MEFPDSWRERLGKYRFPVWLSFGYALLVGEFRGRLETNNVEAGHRRSRPRSAKSPVYVRYITGNHEERLWQNNFYSVLRFVTFTVALSTADTKSASAKMGRKSSSIVSATASSTAQVPFCDDEHVLKSGLVKKIEARPRNASPKFELCSLEHGNGSAHFRSVD